ncbi:MAG: ABC transporter permease, partial [Thermomicrobiales bacterium]
VLPAATLGLRSAAFLARITRSTMLDVLGQDYVRTARAKGLSERVVTTRHALRAAMIPLATVIGLEIGGLIGGAVIIESVFAYPGMGQLAVQALNTRDFPLIQGIVLMSALAYIGANLLVDILYCVLDPRVRYS